MLNLKESRESAENWIKIAESENEKAKNGEGTYPGISRLIAEAAIENHRKNIRINEIFYESDKNMRSQMKLIMGVKWLNIDQKINEKARMKQCRQVLTRMSVASFIQDY